MSKWGDLKEDDATGETVVIGSDGVKTTTFVRTDKDGKQFKVTRKTKEIKKSQRVNKKVEARKLWSKTKFGDAAGVAPGPERNITYQTADVVKFDLRPKKDTDKKDDEEESSALAKLGGGGNSIVVCRHCGETGHWTLKCPYRGSIVPKGMEDKVKTVKTTKTEGGETKAVVESKYVPLHLRGDDKAAAMRSNTMLRQDEHVLRVTNLSEDTMEADLKDLFRPFGHTTRIYLVKDRQTQVSRGFAFVNFSTRSQGQAAIDALNGHGYDNLILHVEWSKPREEKKDDTGSGGRLNSEIIKSQKRRF